MEQNKYWKLILTGKVNNESKWAFMDKAIAEFYEENQSVSDWYAAKKVLDSFIFEKDQEQPSVSALRHYISRMRKRLENEVKQYTINIFNSQKEHSNYLVFGDTHHPFELSGYLEEGKYLAKSASCNTIIHIGDMFDFHVLSRWETEEEAMDSTRELAATIDSIKEWNEAFPNLIITIGNHDKRIINSFKDAKLPKQLIPSFNQILGTPNWTWVNEYRDELFKIVFRHGTGDARKYVLYYDYSIVQGHLHSKMYIEYITNNKFAAQVGCGVDSSYYAFNYKTSPKPDLNGHLLIINGVPQLFPYKNQ